MFLGTIGQPSSSGTSIFQRLYRPPSAGGLPYLPGPAQGFSLLKGSFSPSPARRVLAKVGSEIPRWTSRTLLKPFWASLCKGPSLGGAPCLRRSQNTACYFRGRLVASAEGERTESRIPSSTGDLESFPIAHARVSGVICCYMSHNPVSKRVLAPAASDLSMPD